MPTVIPLDNIITVIERDETNQPEPKMNIVRENIKYCPHERLNIFKHHRKVSCKDCGANLEAFDVLCNFANKENNTLHELNYLKYQLKDRKDELENLGKRISYLKQVKRKLEL